MSVNVEEELSTKINKQNEADSEIVLSDDSSNVDVVAIHSKAANEESCENLTPEKALATETDQASGDMEIEENPKENEDSKAKLELDDNGILYDAHESSTSKCAADDEGKELNSQNKDDKTTILSENKLPSEVNDNSVVITATTDNDVTENEESNKSETKSPVVNENPSKSKPQKPPSMWVSNIARQIKATDLKRIFSKHGRVISARILSNGKNFFGYVCMDSIESIERCIKFLNHTRLGDQKITISRERPDATNRKTAKAKSPVKEETKEAKETETEDEPTKSDAEKSLEDNLVEKEKSSAKSSSTPKKQADSPDKDSVAKFETEAPPEEDEISLLKEKEASLEKSISKTRDRLKLAIRFNEDMEVKARRAKDLSDNTSRAIRIKAKSYKREKEKLEKKIHNERIQLEAEREFIERDRKKLEDEMKKLIELRRTLTGLPLAVNAATAEPPVGNSACNSAPFGPWQAVSGGNVPPAYNVMYGGNPYLASASFTGLIGVGKGPYSRLPVPGVSCTQLQYPWPPHFQGPPSNN